ncbi:3-phosphoshikimate 1-carboxyvinyltransferase [Chlamydia sp.]|uniref:3-phosphoshikimate 1-carboxyvinyltransferase n=1 Tax=Chlamydia sp. TaxID=35827 RepID=UPI0025B8D954|nr:3-phosphoshikimate 1-carboxyvinyltransferase [Chlamydia sp.]MBQ8498232.1 3-phosphoshikimate 1-carboxyvinyltransferase [Chlamydia sp.]
MNQALLISPSTPYGEVTVPPSKSHSLRAILFASLSQGLSVIDNCLSSSDTYTMLTACKKLGSQIKIVGKSLHIQGNPHPQDNYHRRLHMGNSGIALRFLTALSALSPSPTLITGTHSLKRRPIMPLLSSLKQLGIEVRQKKSLSIPFVIRGPLSSGHTIVSGQDSQYASALAITAAIAPEPLSFSIENLKERPWFDMTLNWLNSLNISFSRKRDFLAFPGGQSLKNFSYSVPGDFSSAAFLAALGLLSSSPNPTILHNLPAHDSQGDKQLFFLLKNLGANILIGEHHVEIHPSSFSGGTIDMDPFIDALPILAVLCCFAKKPSRLYNARGAKDKESNRIKAISQELRKMGGLVYPTDDGLYIEPSRLHGAVVCSHNDHRIAMALAVAGVHASSGQTILCDTRCINKSFPHFVVTARTLHANIQHY